MEHEIRGVDIGGQEVTLSGPPRLLDLIQNTYNAYNSAKNAAELVTDDALFAGLDRDGQAKLFTMKPGASWMEPIGHGAWLRVLHRVGARDGELLGVCLIRPFDHA